MRGDQTALEAAFQQFRPALIAAGIFSIFCNLLLFVGPLYMLQVYDRVLQSRSVNTLIALTVIALFLLATFALLDMVRSRVLVRASARFDETIGGPVFHASLNTLLRSRDSSSMQAIRDVNSVREFWAGPGVICMCDAPFAPVFVAVCFLLHPWLGVVALGGAIVLFTFALINEFATRESLGSAGRAAIESNQFATTSARNVEAIRALGMEGALYGKWRSRHDIMMGWQALASDRAGMIMSMSKAARQMLQIGILGVGGWLAINGEISPGTMIAASIIMGRALAPVEQAVGHWRSFVAARSAWGRLNTLFRVTPKQEERTELPAPQGRISVESVFTKSPDGKTAILKGVSFQLDAGQTLAIIGPSASGKSTLVRTVVGVWPLAAGTVRIDGAELKHWDGDRLGSFIGYLPQDVELFAGTVAENIARFQDAADEDIIRAAKLADVHELVLALPEGYDTQIGEGGNALSGGQRQRIALARAIFGDPKFIVLDEPNAHLDASGEGQLIAALRRIKEQGTTIILVTHKPNLLALADQLLVLQAGATKAMGPTQEVLKNMAASPQVVNGGPNSKARSGMNRRNPNAGSAQPTVDEQQQAVGASEG